MLICDSHATIMMRNTVYFPSIPTIELAHSPTVYESLGFGIYQSLSIRCRYLGYRVPRDSEGLEDSVSKWARCAVMFQSDRTRRYYRCSTSSYVSILAKIRSRSQFRSEE